MKDHKLAAIVFTDIVGYTKKMEADEEGTMKLLTRQRERSWCYNNQGNCSE